MFLIIQYIYYLGIKLWEKRLMRLVSPIPHNDSQDLHNSDHTYDLYYWLFKFSTDAGLNLLIYLNDVNW